ncbi:hypothetical protein TNCV_1264251, partial [Trichonephila clavipes]
MSSVTSRKSKKFKTKEASFWHEGSSQSKQPPERTLPVKQPHRETHSVKGKDCAHDRRQ